MMIASIFLAMPGPGSMVLIALAILLLFGGRKIPELMKGLGTGIKEFKNATNEDDKDEKDEKGKKDD